MSGRSLLLYGGTSWRTAPHLSGAGWALYDVKRAAAYYLAIRGSFSGTINSFGVKGLDVERFLKLFPPVSARLKDVPLENKTPCSSFGNEIKKAVLSMPIRPMSKQSGSTVSLGSWDVSADSMSGSGRY